MKPNRPHAAFRDLENHAADKRRRPSVLRGSIGLLAASAASLLTSSTASAAIYYWDTTVTGLWSNGANWSNTATTGGITGVVPLATDTAFFNQSSVNGPELIQLGTATSIAGITFANTGTTQIQASVAGTQTLTVGTSGITVNAGAGAVTIGDFTNQTAITLSGAQTWANNSASLFTIANNVTNGANLLTIGGSGATEISGNIGPGAGGITLAGAATLTLSGANTYSGVTTLSATRTLNFNSAQAIGTGALTITGGTLNNTSGGAIFNANTNALALNGNFAFIGGSDLDLGAGAVTLSAARTITVNANTLTLGGNISGATFGITKAGAGTLALNGVIGTTTGGLSVTAGTLIVGNTANTFTGNVTIAGNTSVLQMNGGTNNATSAPLGIFTGGTAYKTVTLTNGGTFRPAVTYNTNVPTAALPGNGYVFVIGTGGGTFDVPGGVVFTLDDGTGNGTALTNTQLQGTTTLTKTGDGILSLGNAAASNAAFTGQILVNAGTLRLGPMTAAGVGLGSTSANTVIAAGAAFDINNNAGTAAEPVTINGTGIGGQVIFSSNAAGGSFSGPITLGSSSTIGSTTAGTLTFNAGSTFALGSNTLTISNVGTGRVFTDGVISGSGNVVANSSNSGDYVPRAGHTYSGGTTLTAGLVAVDFSSVGPAGSPTSGGFGTGLLNLAGAQMRSSTTAPRTIGNTVTVSADTTFYTAGAEKTLTFTGPVTLTGGARVLTSNVGSTVRGATVLFTGAIGDGGNGYGLTKDGTGNLTLAGANTYTGPTTVNFGVLTLTGSVAANTGLTVAGSSTFSLASGAANPLTSVSALDLGSGFGTANLFFDLGTNTANSDRIVTTAAATTANTIGINVVALPGLGTSSTYNLISAPSGLSGATYTLSGAGGFFYSLNATDTLVQVGVAAAPGTGNLYWQGGLTTSSWSAFESTNTNWTTDAAGAINASYNPTTGNSVIFSAANAPGPAVVTTLDNNFAVNDLQFTSSPAGVTTTTIAPGTTFFGSLTVAPSSSAAGIRVAANAGAVTISAPLVVGASQTWSADGSGANGSALTISGGISGSAGNTVAINGLVTLSAPALASTFSGTMSVGSGGILQGGATNSFSVNSSVVVGGTGILRLNGLANNVAALSGNGTVQNNHAATTATLTVGDATSNTDFSGTLQNGGVAALGLTKVGASTQTLSGNNTYTGTTTISAGTLKAGSATAFNNVGTLTLNGNGTLDLGGFGASFTNVAASATTNTITNSGGSPATLAVTNLANTIAALVQDGAQPTAVTMVNNNVGVSPFSNGNNTFTGGLTLLYNPVTGPNGTRLALGTITTTGPAGAITSGHYGRGTITVGQSPTDRVGLFWATANQTLANAVTVNTTLGTDRTGIRLDTTGNTMSGLLTANLADALFSTNGTGAVALTGKVTGPSGLSLDGSAFGTLLTVTLNNATGSPNDYAGNTTINTANATRTMTLALGAANQIPNGAGKGNVVITSAGTGIANLNLGGLSDTINGLSGNGNVDGISGTPTLTVGDGNATATFSGVIRNTAGTLAVAKIGSGTQTLSGANTFAGTVSANGGRLAFATSANLGNAAATNMLTLNGGALSYTAVGALDLTATRVVTLGASGGTLEVVVPTSTLTVSGGIAAGSIGGLTKTGSGTVVIPGTTGWTAGANVVTVSGGTLRAGFGTSGISALTVGVAGTADLRNSATQTLTLGAGAGAITLNGGARVGFELDGASNDSVNVPAGGTAVTAGTVTLDFFNFGGGVAVGTYNLLSAPGGLDAATYALGSAPLNFNYTINKTPTLVSLTTVAYVPRFWTGAANGSWSANPVTNWATDPAGTTPGTVPGAAETVVFSGANATGPTVTTTLDAPFTVDSLQFLAVPVGVTAVTVNPGAGGTLSLAPASSSAGIFVGPNGGTATIAAPLTVAAAQTWNVDGTGANGSSLVISGNTVFNARVIKTGAGALTLSGNNSGSGAFTHSAGTLNINSATALGTGTFTIGAGATIDVTVGAMTLSTNNVQNWNGSFTFTGTQNLNLGTGAVALVNSATVTVNGNSLTVGGVIGDGGNSRGLTKDGTGDLILTGNNTYTGGTTLNTGNLTLSAANNFGAGAVTVNGGTLNIGHASALGTGPLIINGGAIDNTSPGPLTVAGNNPQTWNGNFTFAGSTDLNLGTGAVSMLVTPTITVSGNTLTVGGAISGGANGLTKAGPGTLVLNGVANYTGATTLNEGTLAFGANQTFTGALNFGAANASTVTSNLDLTNGSASFGSALVRTNSTTPNTVTVGAGKTFALAGLTLGYDAGAGTGATFSRLTVSGPGAMSLTGATITIGTNQAATNAAYWNDSTLDVTALTGGFTANVTTFNIGVGTTTQGPGAVLLSDTSNTIIATTLTVGDTVGNNGRGTGLLVLGAGTNVIQADAFNIGRGKNTGPGVVRFASQNPGDPGTVSITNRAGTGPTALTVGFNNGTATAGGAIGTLDLRGHATTASVSTLILGNNNMTSNTGGVNGTLSFDTGTFSVNTITMGIKTAAGTGPAAGTINVGGGSFTVNTAFTLGSQASAGTSTATLNVTGGTFTSNANIVDGGGASTSTITLDGGTLDLTTHSIGGGNPIDNLNFQSGILRNVGQINNGFTGVTKTSPGTLTLSGTLAYTGDTRISEGTLNVDGALGAGANFFYADAGTTNFNVSQTLGALEIGAGAVVNLGASAPGPTPAETAVLDLMASDSGAGSIPDSLNAADVSIGGAVQAVPEPGSLSLLAAGLLGLLGRRRRSGA
jgi:autotransporter-associated beta strand protein